MCNFKCVFFAFLFEYSLIWSKFLCTGLNLREKAATTPVMISSVGQWLDSIGLKQYEDIFVTFGYDDTDFIVRVFFF